MTIYYCYSNHFPNSYIPQGFVRKKYYAWNYNGVFLCPTCLKDDVLHPFENKDNIILFDYEEEE